MRRIHSLAGVRIIATMMITLYHMEFFQLNTGFMGRFHHVFSGFGSMGVALFIIMSGFLNMYNFKFDQTFDSLIWGDTLKGKSLKYILFIL